MKRFVTNLGVVFEILPDIDGMNCKFCVAADYEGNPYRRHCSIKLCEEGHFALADTESDEYLLARLKGEV